LWHFKLVRVKPDLSYYQSQFDALKASTVNGSVFIQQCPYALNMPAALTTEGPTALQNSSLAVAVIIANSDCQYSFCFPANPT